MKNRVPPGLLGFVHLCLARAFKSVCAGLFEFVRALMKGLNEKTAESIESGDLGFLHGGRGWEVKKQKMAVIGMKIGEATPRTD